MFNSAIRAYPLFSVFVVFQAAYVLKALKHYIKAEQKDRLHTVNHYKHEADTDSKEALSLRPQTLNHLRIIDQRVQQAVDMLNRVPKIEKKVRTQIGEC